MKKFITYLLLVLSLILIVYWCIPKSCEPSDKSEPPQRKSDRSLIIDSIQKSITDKINKESEAKVKIYKDSLSVIKIQKEKTEANYYALRRLVKGLSVVKVDSFNQVIKVPVIDYNASINSGNMCDSLLMYQDAELNLKDSIISVREIQIESLIKKIETGEVSQKDLLSIIDNLKEALKKIKNENLKLKIAFLINTLLHLVH